VYVNNFPNLIMHVKLVGTSKLEANNW